MENQRNNEMKNSSQPNLQHGNFKLDTIGLTNFIQAIMEEISFKFLDTPLPEEYFSITDTHKIVSYGCYEHNQLHYHIFVFGTEHAHKADSIGIIMPNENFGYCKSFRDFLGQVNHFNR